MRKPTHFGTGNFLDFSVGEEVSIREFLVALVAVKGW